MSQNQEEVNIGQGIAVLAVCIGLFVGLAWLGAMDKRQKAIEDAKPAKMAPCEDVLDPCYKPSGTGDAAWLIKQQDRLYGTRQHEAQVDKALGAINAQAICDHKKRQGVECN